MFKSRPYLFSLFLGNFLSHYHNALSWALSPFLARLLFPDQSFLEGLTLFYLLIPMSKWAKPVGAILLGRLSVKIGTHKTLVLSLSGLALGCIAMVFCPTDHPAFAFGYVAICRVIKNFFAPVESSASTCLILQGEKEKRGLLSGLIGSTHLLGYLVSALLVALIAAFSSVEANWRWLYLSGAVTGICALVLRLLFKNEAKEWIEKIEMPKEEEKKRLFDKKKVFLIALASCFSYGTYEVSMAVSYSALSAITSTQANHILWLNFGLLTFDALLLPYFGRIAEKYGKELVMGAAAIIWVISSGFLMDRLHGASFIEIAWIRMVLVLIGVVFAGPYYSWAEELLPKRKEVLHLSVGSALGKYLGGFLPTSILFLYQKFESFALAIAPLTLISLGIGVVLLKSGFERRGIPEENR